VNPPSFVVVVSVTETLVRVKGNVVVARVTLVKVAWVVVVTVRRGKLV